MPGDHQDQERSRSVSVPRYQVALKRTMRLRTLVANRWRKIFCWMASARWSVLEPVPLRKTDRHTLLPRTLSIIWSVVHGHAHILRNCSGGMSVERSTIRSPSSLTQVLSQGSGLGAGPSIFSSGALEFTAVAGARDDAQVLVPCGQDSPGACIPC